MPNSAVAGKQNETESILVPEIAQQEETLLSTVTVEWFLKCLSTTFRYNVDDKEQRVKISLAENVAELNRPAVDVVSK